MSGKRTVKDHHEFAVARRADYTRLSKDLATTEKSLKENCSRTSVLDRAREVINEVLILTQGQTKNFVEDVVSLALSTVYRDEYKFELEYDIKRNRSEAVPWIVKGGDKFSPREEVGGGVLDVVSLSLRMAVWALLEPRPAPVFILDEPGRFLSRDKQEPFGRMLREVSDLLKIQVVLVSHSTDIIQQADRSYNVRQVDGVSHVEEINAD